MSDYYILGKAGAAREDAVNVQLWGRPADPMVVQFKHDPKAMQDEDSLRISGGVRPIAVQIPGLMNAQVGISADPIAVKLDPLTAQIGGNGAPLAIALSGSSEPLALGTIRLGPLTIGRHRLTPDVEITIALFGLKVFTIRIGGHVDLSALS